jgi:hypothetical protein
MRTIFSGSPGSEIDSETSQPTDATVMVPHRMMDGEYLTEIQQQRLRSLAFPAGKKSRLKRHQILKPCCGGPYEMSWWVRQTPPPVMISEPRSKPGPAMTEQRVPALSMH